MKKFESFEPDKTPPVEQEDRYKSEFAESQEEESKKHKGKIEELKEEFKKIIEKLKKTKKTPDNLST